MTYEWEEEIPQPKPQMRKARLVVELDRDVIRDATISDIAFALGVTLSDLTNWLAERERARWNSMSRGSIK